MAVLCYIHNFLFDAEEPEPVEVVVEEKEDMEAQEKPQTPGTNNNHICFYYLMSLLRVSVRVRFNSIAYVGQNVHVALVGS